MTLVEIAACQVHVTAADYVSEDSFAAMLERLGKRLVRARARDEKGKPLHPCLVVFPEMIGTFLPMAGRSRVIGSAKTTDQALTRVALRSLPSVVAAMRKGHTLSTKVGFLLAAAPEVRRIYRSAFSAFAKEHGVWTVAGSVLLPRNVHGETADVFEPQDGRVYNTSYAFAPDGRHIGATRKVNLVPTLEDTLGLSPGEARDIEPFETPFGGVATLICYDGFLVPHTRGEPHFTRLVPACDARGASVVAHPAANPWAWEERWVFAEEGERQLRKEQWQCEGIFASLGGGRFSNVKYAVTAHLVGDVLDNHFEGRSQILERTEHGVNVIAEAARAGSTRADEEVVLRAVEL
ncbi:MAG: carbon-nitrogen hydrolase family protein [Polyangiaceae bacterium]|nr:carbon-nitrogen hydrolase family protein [Polyangiaceae bacterium]